jgi:hypothetical protein
MLSINEIKVRASEFSRNYSKATSENADKQTFYNDFFNIFGLSRKRVASFEYNVSKLGNKRGSIDLLWKGILLVEHKSKGQNLDKAYTQAIDYFEGLKEEELPIYVLVSDFSKFKLYDLETNSTEEFNLSELYNKVHLFNFMTGRTKVEFKEEPQVNIEASNLMASFFDTLAENHPNNSELELFLIRIMFCLFAEDTGIFEKGYFTDFIENKTKEDGSDLGSQINHIFQTLNTPIAKRPKIIDEELNNFEYINGKLFEGSISIFSFNSKMRENLLKCCYFDWSKISPAIFGSLFQSVTNQEKRRKLGEHYTTEKNILKTIKPLFLNELCREFNNIKTLKTNKDKSLREFQSKLAKIKILDPACGCGNFLIIAYREIRKLETEILNILSKTQLGTKEEATQSSLSKDFVSKVDVDNFYGFEIETFPAKIAEVAMWLMDHLMNLELSNILGVTYARIPLQKSANIIIANALTINWENYLNPQDCTYILGNPPFVGSKMMSTNQRNELENVTNGIKGNGTLDYVCSWYFKAAQYIQNTNIKVAFVSTNSICQGEQVGILWGSLLNRYKISINFAHQTFIWESEARAKAHVYCIIVGFSLKTNEVKEKTIFEYQNTKGEAIEYKVTNINPYLVDAENIVISSRQKPICTILQNIPEMKFGNMPLDGGHLLFSNEEKIEFIKKEVRAEKFIKPLISAREFLNGEQRWCLWLVDASPEELKAMPEVLKRVEKIKEYRLKSDRDKTRSLATTPTLFGEIRNNQENYLAIPQVSSENRVYIPIAFFGKEDICNSTCLNISNATLYHFGVLTSKMHMAWVKYVCGRLEGRFRYSKDIVYNNFPWAKLTPKQQEKIEIKAQNVLNVREKFTKSSLANLYSPLTMPAELSKAHMELDKAVDEAYSSDFKTLFSSESKRVAFLFSLYKNYLNELTNFEEKSTKNKRKNKNKA